MKRDKLMKRKTGLRFALATIARALTPIFSLLIIVCSVNSPAQAQDKHSEQNFQPGVPFAISDIESINTTNGNLMFNLNFGNVRGRGTATQGISLKYNSKLYETHVMSAPDLSGNMNPQKFLRADYEGGWQYDKDYRLRVISRNDDLEDPVQAGGGSEVLPPWQGDGCIWLPPNYKSVYKWKLMMYFPDGSQHEFRPTGYSDESQDQQFGQFQTKDGYFNVDTSGKVEDLSWGTQGPNGSCSGTPYAVSIISSQSTNPQMTYYSTDGTFMRLVIPNGQNARYPATWTIYMPDGSKITNGEPDGQGGLLKQRVYDKNGNYVTQQDVTLPDASAAPGYVDQLGRYIAKKQISPTEDWIYKQGVGGEPVIWKVKWKWITVIKEYITSGTIDHQRCCYSYQDLSAQHKVVDEIILPDQLVGDSAGDPLKYKFTYDAHDGQIGYDPNNPNYSSGWGDLTSVTLPSGAKAEYDYDILLGFGADEMLKDFGKIKEKRLIYNTNYDGASETVTEKWLYNIKNNNSTITGPDGGVTKLYFNSVDVDSDLSGRVHKEIKPDGTIIERIWQHNKVGGCPPYGCGSMRRLNTYIKTEFTSIADNAGNPTLTAIKDFDYDKNGNVTKVTEYDYVSYGAAHDSSGVITGIPSGAAKARITETGYYNPTEDASNSASNHPNSYWNFSAKKVNNAVKSSTIKNAAGTPVSSTRFEYDNPDTTANPVKTMAWDSVKAAFSNPLNSSNSISITATYDDFGNVLTTTDARGIVSQLTYGAINGHAGLYPTETRSAYGTPQERTATAEYDFYTGLVTSSTDADNNVTSAVEYDALGRPLKNIAAQNTASEIWTQTEYDDVWRRVIIRSDLETKGDGKSVSVRHFDELGRVRLARSIENSATEDPYNEADGIKVQTRYRYDDGSNPAASNGVYSLTSNPFRAPTSAAASNESTMGWTLGHADKSGRHSTRKSVPGPELPAPWGSNGDSTGVVSKAVNSNSILVTDASGRQRRSITNSLGQLMRVDEPDNTGNLGTVSNPAQPTAYKYGTGGQLVEVTQGVQKRFFLYDSLGRMVRVRQPEQEINSALNLSGGEVLNTQWTAGFTHDENGNILTATDAENKTINASYDAQNRVLGQTYSDDVTPAVTYTYDDVSVAYSKGRLTGVENSVSKTATLAFDELGRPVQIKQTTGGVGYLMKYIYNLSGAIVEEEYPSGRKVKNELDPNGDILRIYGKASTTGPERTYATGFEYTADGKVEKLKIGNGKWESAFFNSNLQATELALGASQGNGDLWKLNYEYGELNANGTVDTTKNTGNIAKQIISFDGLPAPFVQTYKYDSLHRISEAKEMSGGQQTWAENYGYDRFGNRTSFSQNVLGAQLATNNITTPGIDTYTNRFSNGQGYEYDKIGNLKKDVTPELSRDITFDGNNKQTEISDSSTGNKIGEYFYDGNGRRVKKRVFDSSGQMVEDVVFVYSGERLIAEYSTQPPSTNPTTKYVATDTLGSIRAITNQDGEIISRRDFMPFGQELQTDTTYRIAAHKYNPDDVRQKFTGYQKDEESGLDFAEARMYNNAHGRFTAVDPLLASGKSANPQTFNRYVYSMNRPLVLTDPTGMQAGEVVVPNRIVRFGNARTASVSIGGVNGTAHLPKPLIAFQSKLVKKAYSGQALIANASRTNKLQGTINPTTETTRTETERSNSNTSQSDARVEIEISKDPGINPSGGVREQQNESSRTMQENEVSGDSTSVVAQKKELISDINLEIGNFLNANENENGEFTMLVTFEDNTGAMIDFSRSAVEDFLYDTANAARTAATCDFNEQACPRMKPKEESNDQ